jgi:S-adenosylmethionine/arginine decarboxylase-like enzyme
VVVPQIRLYAPEIPDLAPAIYRQRMILEGVRHAPFSAQDIEEYLVALSRTCDMEALIDPVTHRSERYGWSGWIHWEASGAHFYAWEHPVFFSVDIYTCAPFDPETVAQFTAEYLKAEQLVGQTF